MDNIYRVIKAWDDEKADWTYCLEIDNGHGNGWEKTIYGGDVAWAIREAEYYGAEIVEKEQI